MPYLFVFASACAALALALPFVFRVLPTPGLVRSLRVRPLRADSRKDK